MKAIPPTYKNNGQNYILTIQAPFPIVQGLCGHLTSIYFLHSPTFVLHPWFSLWPYSRTTSLCIWNFEIPMASTNSAFYNDLWINISPDSHLLLLKKSWHLLNVCHSIVLSTCAGVQAILIYSRINSDLHGVPYFDYHDCFLNMAHTAYTSARCMCVLHSSQYNLQDGNIFSMTREGREVC